LKIRTLKSKKKIKKVPQEQKKNIYFFVFYSYKKIECYSYQISSWPARKKLTVRNEQN